MGAANPLNFMTCYACRDVGPHGTLSTSLGGEFKEHWGQASLNCILSIDATVPLNGNASLKVARTGSGDVTYDTVQEPGKGIGEHQASVGFAVYIPSGHEPADLDPTYPWVTLFGFETAGYVALGEDMKLRIVDASGVDKKTTITVLSPDTLYWVALKINQRDPGAAGTDFWLRVYNAAGTLLEEISCIGAAALYTDLQVFMGVRTLVASASSFTYHLGGGYSVIGDFWPPVLPTFVDGKVPTGLGTYNNWTSSVPGNKWLDVDDVPDNADTDYNYRTVTAAKQTFSHAASGIPVGSNVLAVGVRTMTRKYAGVIVYGYGMMRLGGTDLVGDTYSANAATYSGQGRVLTTKTPAGADWTIANVDAVEIGMDCYFLIGAPNIRCSSVVLFAAYGDEEAPPPPSGRLSKVMIL